MLILIILLLIVTGYESAVAGPSGTCDSMNKICTINVFAAVDQDPNSTPTYSDATCTLREAILNGDNHGIVRSSCARGGVEKTIIRVPMFVTITYGALDINSKIIIQGHNDNQVGSCGTTETGRSSISGNSQSQVFYVHSGGELFLNSVDVVKGVQVGASGGCVLAEGHLVTNNVCFGACTADRGAAVSISAAFRPYADPYDRYDGNFRNTVFNNNQAAIEGGALWVGPSSYVSLYRSNIIGNRAFAGGGAGIYSPLGTPSIRLEQSAVVSNTAYGSDTAGGAGIQTSGTLSLYGTVVAGNGLSGAKGGAGIYATSGTKVYMTDSVVSANVMFGSQFGLGGGLHLGPNTVLQANRCSISENIATLGGGCIWPQVRREC